ncbi:MAG: CdaR family protein [Flavobacteriaceae bacterium]|nr:CdaR family protein [Flavobacteriaceae bacterium]
MERVILVVNPINLPQDETITLKSPEEIEVEISAVGFRILAYYIKDLKVNLDLNEAIKSDSAYWYPTSYTDKLIKDKVGYAVEILSVTPDTLKIPFATLASKKVPIKLKSDVSLALGYDFVDNVELRPDSVTVIGSPENLKNVDSIETELFRKTNVSNSVKEFVPLVPLDGNLKLANNKTQVILNINKFTEGTLQVPVKIVNLPQKVKINYFPKTVPVSFYVNLQKFSEVEVDDFTVECDYNQVKDTKKDFFTPRLTEAPDFVRNAKVKLDKVEFIITQ